MRKELPPQRRGRQRWLRKAHGVLRVIDAEAGKSCLGFETAISWNQGGPKGPIGDRVPTGDRGPTGTKGPQGDAGPGAEGLVGYERVSFTSPSDSFWYKGYAAACPRGKHVIAGGYRTSGTDAFHVDGSFPEDVSWTDAAGAYVAEAWRVLVRDPQARTDRNWGVTVWAVCAK
ncbi:MAG: hypothetical protein QOJ43_2210 [Gaiellaceae bacterium]|nr:hypothetical protein [Gaiellaceae bacterium]